MRAGNINSSNIQNINEIVFDSGELAALDSYTKLLIHGDSISDSTGKTVTANGGAAVTTAQYKFPKLGRSIYLDGSGDYLSLADSSDWNFGSGDFTIDFWVRHTSIYTVAEAQNYCAQWVDGNNQQRLVFYDHYKLLYFFSYSGGVGTTFRCSFDPAVGTWYHIAFVRKGSTSADWLMFIDGISQSVTKVDGNYNDTLPDVGASLFIGNAENTQYLFGYISEFRISKGVARWTSNFTPPTDIYGGPTTYLCATGLNGNTDEKYQIISRQIGGPVNCDYMRFSINEDSGANYGLQRLYATNSTAGAIRGTGNSYGLITYNATPGSTSLGEYVLHAKSGYARTWVGAFTGEFETTSNETEEQGNVWNNTADNLISFQGFGISNNTIGVGTRLIVIKNAHASKLRTGTMDVLGKVTYAWQEIYNYEVAAAEDSYTKLLIHGDSDTKATTGQAITKAGNAAKTTSYYKFPQIGYSLGFDGSGDYVTIPDSADWAFGTNAHTVDFWIRWNSTPAVSNIWMQYDGTGGVGGWIDLAVGNNGGYGYAHWGYWHIDDSSRFSMSITSGTAAAFVVDRWYHIAVVRIDTSDSSSSWRIYIDGVAQTIERSTGGSYVSWGSANFFDLAAVGTIGIDSSDHASNPHNGQIADLRISNGSARWTSNFTPPSAPYGGTLSNISVNDLAGNTDVIYRLKVKTIAGATTGVMIRPNNDSGANYRGQYLLGINTASSAERNLGQTGIPINYSNFVLNDVSYAEGILYAKSGYNRTYLGKASMRMTLDSTTYTDEAEWTTQIAELQLQGTEWVNSSNEITALGIMATADNGIGPGSKIIVERLNL